MIQRGHSYSRDVTKKEASPTCLKTGSRSGFSRSSRICVARALKRSGGERERNVHRSQRGG